MFLMTSFLDDLKFWLFYMVVEALIRKSSLKSLVTPEMKNYLIVPWDTKRNEIDLMDCVEYYRKNIYIFIYIYTCIDI